MLFNIEIKVFIAHFHILSYTLLIEQVFVI